MPEIEKGLAAADASVAAGATVKGVAGSGGWTVDDRRRIRHH